MSAHESPTSKSKSTRPLFYGIVVLIVAAVVGAAAFQEQLGYFFRLRAWDKDAPGHVVSSFLKAGSEPEATKHLGTADIKPLEKDGKWIGYMMITNAGTLEYVMSELAPKDANTKPESELEYVGAGAAIVKMPDSKGKPIAYRLIMTPAGWKISEIRGGRRAG